MDLNNATSEQLIQLEQSLSEQYQQLQALKLNLDLTRGKPSAEQLSLSNALDGILNGDYISKDGTDTRNYGGLEGIIESREMGATVLDMPIENILAQGSSSLTLMYQLMSTAYFFGLTGKQSAWHLAQEVSVICPVPGYDRHFSICEQLGIKMINVPMTSNGPDMDVVESLIKQDSSIRGMWCVPKYSNPTGVVYSDQTVERIAKLGQIAHKDFRVFWDNAYAIHDLSDNPVSLSSIFSACDQANTQDSVLQFASTSKVTLAGAGVAFLGASETNLKGFKAVLGVQTIGPDKTNQLRHARFFEKPESLKAHMKKHAQIIKPRFDSVLAHLEKEFSNTDLGKWESADGGYFISFDTQKGLAKKVVQLAADAGVKLTPAGATFPYGNDPEDSNIRIAPTVPTVKEVDQAMQIFTLCVKLASVQQRL
ncbi:aminotransferase class I/II-fold pyridoxal phosphate-dependent enzyme [Marinicellulosiphila megalodicopiae]|uniref:aminotransferase class I/II-fold pyridoxal phosphate-dependent enzyme n=1 Tax=Marinicellulosiphila megalodicopiae TaxID=2724896 RepID=UPI003BAFEDDE